LCLVGATVVKFTAEAAKSGAKKRTGFIIGYDFVLHNFEEM